MATYLSDTLRAHAPAYCAIGDDGAKFLCADCQEEGHASLFWLVATPNGKVQTLHKTCVDADWIANATLVAGEA